MEFSKQIGAIFLNTLSDDFSLLKTYSRRNMSINNVIYCGIGFGLTRFTTVRKLLIEIPDGARAKAVPGCPSSQTEGVTYKKLHVMRSATVRPFFRNIFTDVYPYFTQFGPC